MERHFGSSVTDRPSKSLVFMGSSERDLHAFPVNVKRAAGYALRVAQQGGKHPDAKPLRGYKGTGVLEIVEDFRTDTYRAVYMVDCAEVVFVLHAFQKKSKTGKATPKADLDLIKRRYQQATKICKNPLPDIVRKMMEYRAAVAAYDARLAKIPSPTRTRL